MYRDSIEIIVRNLRGLDKGKMYGSSDLPDLACQEG